MGQTQGVGAVERRRQRGWDRERPRAHVDGQTDSKTQTETVEERHKRRRPNTPEPPSVDLDPLRSYFPFLKSDKEPTPTRVRDPL